MKEIVEWIVTLSLLTSLVVLMLAAIQAERQRKWTADEPLEFDGEDQSPWPGDSL